MGNDANSVTFRDNPTILLEGLGLLVLGAAAIIPMRLIPWQWCVPLALFAAIAVYGAIRVIGDRTSVHLATDGIRVKSRSREFRVEWDRIRACEFDTDSQRYSVFWLSPTAWGYKWDELARANARLRDQVLAKAPFIDPAIKRALREFRPTFRFSLEETLERLDAARPDVDRDLERYPESHKRPSGGRDTLTVQLAEARSHHEAPSLRLGRFRCWIASLGLVVIGTIECAVTLAPLGDAPMLFSVGAIAFMVLRGGLHVVTSTAVIGATFVSGYAFAAVAAATGVNGAWTALLVVSIFIGVGGAFYLWVFGFFDKW